MAGGYFILFWLLDAVHLTAFGDVKVAALASAWPAVAVLGCVGVVFRRTAPTAMAWMCGIAAAGLLFAGHAGGFLLVFEFFFSLVLFGKPRASQLASRAAWVLTVLLIVAAYGYSRAVDLAVVAGFFAVLTLLTPVEWAGNLRKANQLADSESARADAVEDAAQQRSLADRNAHELALEHERQHLARELHDVISARLSAIALQSGAAVHAQDSPLSGGGAVTVLHQIREESVAGLNELNTMIRLLHTGTQPESTGLVGDLPGLLGRYRATGTEFDYENSLPDAGSDLPVPLQSAIYRITSEALANAAKHAPGQPVEVTLTHAATKAHGLAPQRPGVELHLCVRSALLTELPSGVLGTGTGIPSMHFRAAHVGGTLSAAPHGMNWIVSLQIPLPASDKRDVIESGDQLSKRHTA